MSEKLSADALQTLVVLAFPPRPLADITALERVVLVVHEGRIVK